MFFTLRLTDRRERLQGIPFSELKRTSDARPKTLRPLLPPATVGAMLSMTTAALAATDGTQELKYRVIEGFQPLLSLIQGIAFPLGSFMLLFSFTLIMTGNKSKGIEMAKWAAIGYLGMQFAPALMKILVEVGDAISATGN